MKIDICYVISHGFAARMLFQTGLISKLARAGFSIAVITPDASDENLQFYAKDPSIQIFESNEKQDIWDDDYNFKRKYYLEDIKKNPALWEKHVYALRYSTSKHPWKRLHPLFYYWIYKLIKIFPGIRKHFIKKESQYLESINLESLLKKINPRLVVSTYPVSLLEAKILYAAQKNKIPTLTHLLSWDNISTKGRFPITSDFFIVWGSIMEKELEEYYGIAKEYVFSCGVPHFDHHIKMKKANAYKNKIAELGLDPNLPYLFVAMSAPRFAPREIDIVERLVQLVDNNIWGDGMQLVIRPHPQIMQGSMQRNSWLKRLKKIDSKKVAIDYPRLVESRVKWSMKQKDMDHLSNLILGCSVCINSGSTVSIDALMLDKPVILSSFDGDSHLSYWRSARRLIDYTHLKKLVNLGGVYVARSYQDLKNQISALSANPDLDMDKRRATIESQCLSTDGQSTQRAVNAMQEIMEKIMVISKEQPL